jgi:hypothetical protein
MKGFAPTAASNGFSHDLLWSGLRPGCRAMGKPVDSIGVTDNDWLRIWPSSQLMSKLRKDSAL